MKYINIILIAILLLSCSREDEKGQFEPVVISKTEIPLTAKIGEVVPIHVNAYAPNGCWSNLQISLTESNENHYQITAKGFNSGGSVCPEVLIQKDTVFNLTFDRSGEYYFQSNRSPFTIMYDTIRVNE
jgi:hypothetical protein